MTPRNTIIFVLPLLLFSGCMVTSLNPIYTDKDLVYWPELEGTWQGDILRGGETYRFEREGIADQYIITFGEDGESIKLDGHLAQIKGRIYLDLVSSEGGSDRCPQLDLTVPFHLFYMVELKGDTLRIRSMDTSWVKERREKGRLWIANRADGDSTLLTADTARVQRFLRRWGNCEDAWDDWTELRRAPANARPAKSGT
jgi:hypothetical protein